LNRYEGFGLNCYGCCEVLDNSGNVVKGMLNIGRVSVSYLANFEKNAENLEDKYIFYLNTYPLVLVVSVEDKESISRVYINE